MLQVRREARGAQKKQNPSEALQDILAACDRCTEFYALPDNMQAPLPGRPAAIQQPQPRHGSGACNAGHHLCVAGQGAG